LKFSKQFENVVAEDELSACGERSRYAVGMNRQISISNLHFRRSRFRPSYLYQQPAKKKLAQISGQLELVRKGLPRELD
jgi:hypothetical protein